jgi:hypothetical protein
MLSRIIYIFLFISYLNLQILAAGDEPPSWLTALKSTQTPTYEKDVPAVALHDEQTVTMDSEGKMTIVTNYAIKVLLREGKGLALARASYLVSSSRVREMNAWLIRADGYTKKYDKDKIIDIIADPDDVYNEYRLKIADASDDADVSSIFGYTVVTEEKPLFYQDVWAFQDRLPTIMSRYTLNLPNGWQAKSIAFNRQTIEPTVNGSSYTWELRNMSPIPSEPMSPSVKTIAPYITVNYFPKENPNIPMRTFKDWREVSVWTSSLHDSQVIIDDPLAAKVRDLTANAKTELEKIRAIGTFVQNLQYISIDIGVGYGNGYRPRPSTTVLSRAYGDCKDKANLMRTMLRVLKIESYPVAIFSGDPTYVREEWVSPQQFNHCIIAIKVSDETKVPSVITHAKLGRLLIFDATDPYTPVGDLPEHEQGSFALIAAGENGGLARMPVTPPEANKLERSGEFTMNSDGSLNGIIREKTIGQASASFRAEFRGMPFNEYSKAIENWVVRGVTGAKVGKITPLDFPAEGKFDLDIEFSAPSYGQLMQNRLLVFKPVVVSRREFLYLTENKRFTPILMDSLFFTETMTFKLPSGFIVDETPDPVKLETSFGNYSTSYQVNGDKLVFTRSLLINPSTVPLEKYNSVREFYSKIRDAENAPVVLLRK